MNRLVHGVVIAALVCIVSAHGQETAGGFRSDLVGQISYVEKQILDLEGAIPQKKMTWRPAKGVRSISEAYMHIVFANYLLAKFAGFEPPADVQLPDMKGVGKWEASVTDKKKIAEMLQHSFTHLKNTIMNMSDADLEKPVTFFGTETNVRGMLLTAFAHQHEHLGQSVAYARMNGIVPPWTAAQQASEQSSGN